MAKKKIWNDEHDITIKGHEVELYVEDKDEENESIIEEYILFDDWWKQFEELRNLLKEQYEKINV